MMYLGEGMTISNMPTTLECSTDCVKVYDLEGVLSLTSQDLEFSLSPRFGGFDNDNDASSEDENEADQEEGQDDENNIIFRTFELPTLTDPLREALEQDLSGSTFAKIWLEAQTDLNTNPKDWSRFFTIRKGFLHF